MHQRMYSKFLESEFSLEIVERDGEFVKSGFLIPRRGGEKLRIENYIPRFTQTGYCESFEFQWNNFHNLQHDSSTGTEMSSRRVWDCTHWRKEDLSSKAVIELGCGPGRFSESFFKYGADLVAVDMSRAVDVNLKNAGLQENLLLIQADINSLSCLNKIFDFVFCYGVLQHTPDPVSTFQNLCKLLTPGGRVSIDVYHKLNKPSPWSTPKYLWRPLAKRLPREALLKILRWYIPRYIDFDTRIRYLPRGNTWVSLMPIPCWNYLPPDRPRQERIDHAVLATFDALSPAYDIPMTRQEVENMFHGVSGLEHIMIDAGANGLVGNATLSRAAG